MPRSRSTAAKLRISPLKRDRSLYMAAIAKAKWASLTPEERSAHAKKMVQAREAKKAI